METKITTIPIKNIYFMLSYAWKKLPESEIASISSYENTDLINLFAKVLANGLNYLYKKGFQKNYILNNQEIKGVKGKIIFNETFNSLSFIKASLHCEFDEFSINILPNKIIKSTIRKLLSSKEIDTEIKASLVGYYRYLREVDEIEIQKKHFKMVRIDRNNSFYEFLLNICEVILKNLFLDEEDGKIKFRNFVKEESTMAMVFENFVRNFYEIELYKKFPDSNVRSEAIEWILDEPVFGFSKQYLPKMKTDISISCGEIKYIIDTKFYKTTLKKHYDKMIIDSNNLYQIFAYIKNYKEEFPGQEVQGMLLYPTIDRELNLEYKIQGQKVSIKTVDLNKDWHVIHERLLALVND
ncbi:5-methylcytosine-specific restriction endonuclease system specificity protein McrC [Candidatus Dojkabacteria bacterium]|nr:5-methylcytosine-specific restriction endonuclease system specificity protein McrC [Candidatus Dojkabacteria bacterium]